MPGKNVIYGGLGAVALLLTILLFWLNQGYGEVGDRCYEIALSLVTVCNRKDLAKVEELSQLVETSLAEGALSPQESVWLNDILTAAKAKNWEDADRQTRYLLRDQVSRAATLPAVN